MIKKVQRLNISTLSTILSLVFFILPTLNLFYSSIQLVKIKKEAREIVISHQIYSNKLDMISLLSEDFTNGKARFLDGGKEVEINGILYDIVFKSQVGDSIFLNVYEDKEETNIILELKKFVRLFLKSKSESKSEIEQSIEFFQSLFYSEFDWNVSCRLDHYKRTIIFYYLYKTLDTYIPYFSPPPLT